jgi:hypothetical protein
VPPGESELFNEAETIAELDALCEHGRRCEVKIMSETGFGLRYEVHGELGTPDGRRPRVCTLWQLDAAHGLISAYPSEE